MSGLSAHAHRLNTRETRLWGAAILAVTLLHLGLFSLLPTPRWERPAHKPGRHVAPIYVQITPDARAPAPSESTSHQAGRVSLPPIAVREASVTPSPREVSPFVVEALPPTVRAREPGRVIPRSWRDRCDLGDGEVSEDAYQACRDLFLNAATPSPGPSRSGRGDPAQDFAAQGAARIAAYEAQRAPAPTGSGNAGPSSTPGSNFGMGEIDRSVVYAQGERPRVNGE
ncbi:MAG: hypothetical protein J0L52_12615 [Caulobacterales bacterium]|nr:hypothetical protein [Caulobacterales bacterium]